MPRAVPGRLLRKRTAGGSWPPGWPTATTQLPAHLTVTLTAGADFADLFEVKTGQTRAAPARAAAADSALTFGARRNHRRHGLLIRGDGNPVAARRELSWRAVVPARGEWRVTVEVIPVYDGV